MPVKPYMTSLPPDASLYDSPPVAAGDKVLWSPNPDWRLVRPAQVISANGDTVNVVANTESGFQVKLACLHRGNPRASQQLDRFNGGESGVWDVHPDTTRLQRLEQQVARLERQLQQGNGVSRPVRSRTAPLPPPQIPMPVPVTEHTEELVL